MKLFYAAGSCSLSPHIVLREAGLAFELERVDMKSKKTESGTDFLAINPKGYVPALLLDNGSVLTEGPAIVQYLADLAPQAALVPPFATFERYQVMEMLNFISTELHKGYSPLFNPATSEEGKAAAREKLATRIALIDAQLQKTAFLTGAHYSVADVYAFVVLGWSRHVKVDLAPWPHVQAFLKTIAERPAVHAAMVAEGLLQRA